MTDLSKFKVANAFKHLDSSQGMADGIASGFSSIRYRGKAWTLNHGGQTYSFRRNDDGSPLTYVDVIILGVSQGLSKLYFGKQEEWSEDNASGPICASLKGDVPDPGVSIPQSKSCGICPHNEWRTGDKKGKECQDHKRMAVLLMPTMTQKMLKTPLLEPVFLKIPPGSLKSLKSYSDELTHQGIPFAAVVTRISFSQDRLFQMQFELIQALSDAEAPLVLPLMEDQQTKAIVGGASNVRRIAPPPPAEPEETGLLSAFGGAGAVEVDKPKRGRGKAAAKPVIIDAKPVEEPDESDESDEPEETGTVPFEESDTDLDATVARVMGNKLNNMLK